MTADYDLSMPLEEAMLTQRAIRRLKSDPVPDALVLRLVELALKAPTGSNRQGWEFIIVKDPQVKAGLARVNRQLMELYGSLGRRATRDDPKRRKILEAVQWQADHFEEVPVIVVACSERALAFPSCTSPRRPTSARSSPRCKICSWQRALAGSGGGADDHPAVEPVRCAADSGLAVGCDALRRDPAGLAPGALRSDDAQAGAGGGLLRPLRQRGGEARLLATRALAGARKSSRIRTDRATEMRKAMMTCMPLDKIIVNEMRRLYSTDPSPMGIKIRTAKESAARLESCCPGRQVSPRSLDWLIPSCYPPGYRTNRTKSLELVRRRRIISSARNRYLGPAIPRWSMLPGAMAEGSTIPKTGI